MGAGDLVAMVLCAGLGTRLRPLTEWLPKPAVPVCGLPLVQYALAVLGGAGHLHFPIIHLFHKI